MREALTRLTTLRWRIILTVRSRMLVSCFMTARLQQSYAPLGCLPSRSAACLDRVVDILQVHHNAPHTKQDVRRTGQVDLHRLRWSVEFRGHWHLRAMAESDLNRRLTPPSVAEQSGVLTRNRFGELGSFT